MQLRMWSYDLAREQTPTLEHLRRLCQMSLNSGYNALGLYMEHRFAYSSAPWAHGKGAVTPDVIRELENEFPDLQIIPMINLLGHMEGFLYTEYGKRFREELFKGMQACPSNPEFVRFAEALVDDTIAAFKSDIIHIGGDETWQLGACPACKGRVEAWNEAGHDGKAQLYAAHFAPLAQRVIDAGRRPAVWGDMFLEHPTALDELPRETLIFDWQYFGSPVETSRRLMEKGHGVVCCPTIQTYNSAWTHVSESLQNVKDHISGAAALGAEGVCLTTWECALFGNYETILPMIDAVGDSLSRDIEPNFLEMYGLISEDHADWARLMGVDLQSAGGSFAYSTTRSSLKCRLLLYSNPFLAWMHHHEELTGEVGDKALAILDHAISIAPDASYRGVSEFVRGAIEFVRYADQARQAYAQELPGVAVASLAPCRQIFENMERTAKAVHMRIGGSLADVERCKIAREHVERVIRRVKEFGDGSLGYLPAWEYITHPKFVPHDQAAWWLINRWANE